MGGRVSIPAPPPPPPAPRDEGDVVNLATLLAQRASVSRGSFRQAFFGGPRGPGGPDWQAPEVTTPPAEAVVTPTVPPPGVRRPSSVGVEDRSDNLNVQTGRRYQRR